MAEWSKAADCKSVATMLHRFESYSLYSAYTMFLRKMNKKKNVLFLNNLYSLLFSVENKYCPSKHAGIRFSYIVFFKRIYFVRLNGVILNNSKKIYSVNQTLTVSVKLRRDHFIFSVPTQTKAISILR